MSRVYNFSAGPAVLPEEVLKEAAEEMLDYRGCGMSVMEMSHRSKVYDNIIKEAEITCKITIMDMVNFYFYEFDNTGKITFAGAYMVGSQYVKPEGKTSLTISVNRAEGRITLE